MLSAAWRAGRVLAAKAGGLARPNGIAWLIRARPLNARLFDTRGKCGYGCAYICFR
jgi:hypothetical protein